MIGYLDKVIRPLALALPKMSRYVKIFKVNEDKNNKLMSLPIDDEKLLDEYKIICNRTEDLKNIDLNAL